MNIFILSKYISKCAKLHCDKHVVKMILEITQLLYTAWWHGRDVVDWERIEFENSNLNPYKATHKNHPCAIWVRSSEKHYNWALNLAFDLCNEYTRRYGKIHKCFYHLNRLKKMGYPKLIQEETYQPDLKKRAYINCPEGCEYFDCVIGDEYFDKCAVYNEENKLDCVKSYRNYYMLKDIEMKWNKGKEIEPKWYLGKLYKTK
jgi:hypothetical protein